MIVLADGGLDAIVLGCYRVAILGGTGDARLPLLRKMREIPDAILRAAGIEIDQRHFLRRRHEGHRAPRIDDEAQIGMFIAVDKSAKRTPFLRVVDLAQDLRLIILDVFILQHEFQHAARCFRPAAGAVSELVPRVARLRRLIGGLRLALDLVEGIVGEPDDHRAEGFVNRLFARNPVHIGPFECRGWL